ncbi:hypothetical protein RQP46_005887 [Phenoliferia psychrophenolica]
MYEDLRFRLTPEECGAEAGMRTTSLTLLALVVSALASSRTAPRHNRLGKRFSLLSAQYATETEGSDYLLSQNLWGMYSGSGSQTTEAQSLSGDTLGWETTYTWADASSSVKSYANVGLETGLPLTLATVGSIPTKWSWSYTTADTDLVADVSYDLWLSEDSTCGNAVSCSTWEVMVWLSGRGGCTPAGSYSKTVTIGGKDWKLWTGDVQNWQIASFVAVDEIADFDFDLMDFFDYLTENLSVATTQYITAIQAGTEPFTGSATLTTSAYSVSVVPEGAVVSSSAALAVVSASSSKASSAVTSFSSVANVQTTTSSAAVTSVAAVYSSSAAVHYLGQGELSLQSRTGPQLTPSSGIHRNQGDLVFQGSYLVVTKATSTTAAAATSSASTSCAIAYGHANRVAYLAHWAPVVGAAQAEYQAAMHERVVNVTTEEAQADADAWRAGYSRQRGTGV